MDRRQNGLIRRLGQEGIFPVIMHQDTLEDNNDGVAITMSLLRM